MTAGVTGRRRLLERIELSEGPPRLSPDEFGGVVLGGPRQAGASGGAADAGEGNSGESANVGGGVAGEDQHGGGSLRSCQPPRASTAV
jgi:hypothetical protein